jgi:hypothetical protein
VSWLQAFLLILVVARREVAAVRFVLRGPVATILADVHYSK